MLKNRKTFIYVLQFGKDAGARIYRIMKNKPVFLGFAEYRCRFHVDHISKWLLENDHVKSWHQLGRDFRLKGV